MNLFKKLCEAAGEAEALDPVSPPYAAFLKSSQF